MNALLGIIIVLKIGLLANIGRVIASWPLAGGGKHATIIYVTPAQH